MSRQLLAAVSFVTLSLSGATLAQTFVVDANNGPGTSFTSIAAATAAVPNGATLIVLPGLYGEFTIQGKGLTVLGGPGVQVNQASVFPFAIAVSNTAPNQPVVLHGLTLRGGLTADADIHDCAGAVLVDGLTLAPPSPFGSGSVRVSRCDQALLRDVTTGGPGGSLILTDSDVKIEGCTIVGTSSHSIGSSQCTSSGVAVGIVGGSTEMVASTLRGGNGNGSSACGPFASTLNRPAIFATNATMRIHAGVQFVAGSSTQPTVPAIDGTGTLRLDGVGQLPIAPTITTVLAPMPTVIGQSANIGGVLTAAARGPVGNLVILVLGLPGPQTLAPGISDSFWINPAVYVFVAIGTPQQGLPLTSGAAVPNNPAFRGTILGWQSVAATANGLEASNPSWTMVQ